jgi:hypothetical protein
VFEEGNVGETISVVPQPSLARDGTVEVRAEIRGHDDAPETLWFRVPAQHAAKLNSSADPFLIGTIFLGMQLGRDLHIHGRVSPALLKSINLFQAIWVRWLPSLYSQVEVTADEVAESPATGAGVACMAFSGGLDSCFSAWRHRPGAAEGIARHPLGAGVFVHGFDIPLSEVEVFERTAHDAREILASIGVPLIPISTNLRELVGTWHDTHGACLAACLHLLGGGYCEGVIASSHSAETLRFPWGSNPLTDPLLSSESFDVHYDAVEFDRMDKAEGIRDWDEAMARVSVCWEGELGQNCGRCIRCVGTALCFAAKGVEPPKVLSVGSLVAGIRELRDSRIGRMPVERLDEILREARATGRASEWGESLAECIRHQRRRRALRKVSKLGRRLRHLARGITSPVAQSEPR